MFRNLLLGGILGGMIVFIWSAISWMLIPWHVQTLHGFQNEAAVSQVITTSVPQSGIYMLPGPSTKSDHSKGPMIFASVKLEGMQSMVKAMVISLITQIIAAFLVTWLLTRTILSYFGRVIFVVIFALAAGIVTHLPYWNWFAFPYDFTLVAINHHCAWDHKTLNTMVN